MTRRFEDRVAIVTGGSSGIGLAVCERLAAEGARVLIVARNERVLDEAAAGIRERGGVAEPMSLDVADPTSPAVAVERALSLWDRLDVLVNCAGMYDHADVLDLDRDRWDEVLRVNLTAPCFFGKAAARAMADRGVGGAIVNVASIDAHAAEAGYASYNASKAGLLGLTQTMAVELAPHGIRVNSVSPGLAVTPLVERFLGPQMTEYVNREFPRAPINRVLRTEEIASVCAYVASDDASGMTGSDVVVDGGLLANAYLGESLPSLPAGE